MFTRSLTIILLFVSGLASAKRPPSSLSAFKVSCDEAPLVETTKTVKDYEKYFYDNRIKIVFPEATSAQELETFLFEYRKFPKPLLAEMLSRRTRIYLIHGESVIDDPRWDPNYDAPAEVRTQKANQKEGFNKTWDGRDWSIVYGSGGMPFAEQLQRDANQAILDSNKARLAYCKSYPKTEHCTKQAIAALPVTKAIHVSPTRILTNKIYDNNGTVNLFLHEHGHSLDNLYAEKGISSSAVWEEVMKSPNYANFTKKLCVENYCYREPNEGFVELFAYYHACEASRTHMERDFPEAAHFFANFTSAKKVMEESARLRSR